MYITWKYDIWKHSQWHKSTTHSNPEVLQLAPSCALGGCGHHLSFKCFDDNPLRETCFSGVSRFNRLSKRLRLRDRQSFVAGSRPRQHGCSRLAAPMSEKKMPEPPGTNRCHCDILWHLHPSLLEVLSIWLLFDIFNSRGAAAEGEMAGGSYETWLLIESDVILIYLMPAPVRFCISWLRRLWRQQGSNGPWCSRRVSCWHECRCHRYRYTPVAAVALNQAADDFAKRNNLRKLGDSKEAAAKWAEDPDGRFVHKIVVHLAQSKCESGIVKGELWKIQSHLPTTQGSFLSLGWGSNPRNSHWTKHHACNVGWKAERLRCKTFVRGCPWPAWLVGLPWFTSTLCGGGLPQMRFLFQARGVLKCRPLHHLVIRPTIFLCGDFRRPFERFAFGIRKFIRFRNFNHLRCFQRFTSIPC